MKKLPLIFLLLFFSCEIIDDLTDVDEIKGPCTIILKDGSIVETTEDIELSVRTQAITYRDENKKLRSLFKDDYQSYTCGN
jgi:hypothetical protein